jgi:hypothetical protein
MKKAFLLQGLFKFFRIAFWSVIRTSANGLKTLLHTHLRQKLFVTFLTSLSLSLSSNYKSKIKERRKKRVIVSEEERERETERKRKKERKKER